MFQLVEADISFDCDPRSRVSQIRIGGGDNRKSFAFWLPGKVHNSVYRSIGIKNRVKESNMYVPFNSTTSTG